MKKLLVTSIVFLSSGLSAKSYDDSSKKQTYVHIDTSDMAYGERIQTDPADVAVNPVTRLLLKMRSDRTTLNSIKTALQTSHGDINRVERGGHTALGTAISHHSVEVVRLLLEAGANPNLIVVNNGRELPSFLHQIIDLHTKESLKMLELHIKHGADIDYDSPADIYTPNSWNRKRAGTPLHYAVHRYLQFDEIKNKINWSIDTMLRISELKEYLHLLSQKIDLLIENGANQKKAPLLKQVIALTSLKQNR